MGHPMATLRVVTVPSVVLFDFHKHNSDWRRLDVVDIISLFLLLSLLSGRLVVQMEFKKFVILLLINNTTSGVPVFQAAAYTE